MASLPSHSIPTYVYVLQSTERYAIPFEKPESLVAMFTHTTAADKHAHATPHQSRKRLASPIYRGARRSEQAREGGGTRV